MTDGVSSARPARRRAWARALRSTLRQVAYEQRVFWRSREAAIFVFLLPILLFVLLGSVYSSAVGGYPAQDYLTVGLLGYGVANTAFGGLAIFLVVRRENGILKRIRSTPLPAGAYLAAVVVSMLAVFALQSASLLALGMLAFGVDAPRLPASLALSLALGAVCFAALGLAVAALIRSAEGSSPIVNVVILPMAFLSGSFGPPGDYPAPLRVAGEALPLRYVIDLVRGSYLDGRPVWAHGTALAVIAVWTGASIAVARRGFGWEPRAR